MEITTGTVPKNGVSLGVTVRLAPWDLGVAYAHEDSEQQADFLLGLVRGLIGYDPDGSHRAAMQATYIVDRMITQATVRVHATLVRETATWLRDLATSLDARLDEETRP